MKIELDLSEEALMEGIARGVERAIKGPGLEALVKQHVSAALGLLTPAEVAAVCSISKSKVSRLIREKVLPVQRGLGTKQPRIALADLADHLGEHRVNRGNGTKGAPGANAGIGELCSTQAADCAGMAIIGTRLPVCQPAKISVPARRRL